jgi:hypothetical protein
MRRSGSLVAVLLLGALSGGCTIRKASAIGPAGGIARDHPRAVRVTRSDGGRVVLDKPRIYADSIQSETGCDRQFTVDGQKSCRTGTGSVALGDVKTLDLRRFDPTRTIALVVSPVFLLGLLAPLLEGTNTLD